MTLNLHDWNLLALDTLLVVLQAEQDLTFHCGFNDHISVDGLPIQRQPPSSTVHEASMKTAP